MTISNTYEFGNNTQVDDLIKESYERIGIIRNEITPLQLQSAILSANLELTAWQGKVPLSWTRKRLMTQMYVGQGSYTIPKGVTRIVDVVAIQPQRMNEGGTAYSSAGGAASNCFNANATAGCTQGSPDGWISYDYGADNPQPIQYIGITPLANQINYDLVIEYSFGLGSNPDQSAWFQAKRTSVTEYFAGQIIWFVVENAPNARSWRIRETGGNTLAIQQIYFSVPTLVSTGDRTTLGLSYTEWMQIPTKSSAGFPSSYFFNAQISPYLILWPVLSASAQANQYSALLYTAYMYIADVAALADQVDIPQRFYDAFVSGLSYRLATKFAPDKVQFLKMAADEAFQLATLTDYETVTLRVQPDFSNYGRR